MLFALPNSHSDSHTTGRNKSTTTDNNSSHSTDQEMAKSARDSLLTSKQLTSTSSAAPPSAPAPPLFRLSHSSFADPPALNRASSNNMNVSLLENVALLNRRSSCSVLPPFSTASDIAFPTLQQVRQQSQSQSQSLSRMISSNTLNDKQKATLDRVTRLAARICGVPIAVITNVGSNSNQEKAPILAHYGLVDCPWKPNAFRVLQPDPEVQRSSGLPFYQHLPLVGPPSSAAGAGGPRVLGTLTLMSKEARSVLTDDESQDLQDLSFLAVQALLEGPAVRRQVSVISDRRTPRSARRQENNNIDLSLGDDATTASVAEVDMDPSKCLIACTAHDLLTPLMGLHMSLSLLQEDPKFVRQLEEQPLQRESFWTAWQSTEVMFNMCQTTIDTLRANKAMEKQGTANDARTTTLPTLPTETQICNLDVAVLLQSLQRLMDPFPKQVPLIMTLAGKVPNPVPIVTTPPPNKTPTSCYSSSATNSNKGNSVDWHILRCALTLLSHACRTSVLDSTSRKPIELRIAIQDDHQLLVECHCDCPIDMEDEIEGDELAPISLALQSVEHQMQAVHGGQYGFSIYDQTAGRAVFWFSVPVSKGVASVAVPSKADRVITLLPQSSQQQHPRIGEPIGRGIEGVAPMMDASAQESRRSRNLPGRSMDPSLLPGLQRQGSRQRSTSLTGNINPLGSRRRTFQDMSGLWDESIAMQPTESTNQALLAWRGITIKAQSTGHISGHVKQEHNFRYPRKMGLSRESKNTSFKSAMKLAIKAGSNPSLGSSFGQEKGPSDSSLHEHQQTHLEKLFPNNQGGVSSERRKPGHTVSGGLERCLQDLLGPRGRDKVPFPQRVRERLLNNSGSAASSKPPLAANSPQRGRRALVIEDSLVIRKTVARALTKLGIETVVQACDGLEGVARMQEEVFDITLCDFSMPNLGGIDCVKQYRQWEMNQPPDRPKQYIIGMSAHASSEDIASGLKVGMNEYHPKPLTIKTLTDLLQSQPLQEAKSELDKAWRREEWKKISSEGTSTSGAEAVTTFKGGLFADFTKSTVIMLDSMNSMGLVAMSKDISRLESCSVKRPKTEALVCGVTN